MSWLSTIYLFNHNIYLQRLVFGYFFYTIEFNLQLKFGNTIFLVLFCFEEETNPYSYFIQPYKKKKKGRIKKRKRRKSRISVLFNVFFFQKEEETFKKNPNFTNRRSCLFNSQLQSQRPSFSLSLPSLNTSEEKERYN